MADTLSIEEMNRTRAALGMPLLPVSSSASGLEFKKPSKSDDEESEEEGSTLESRQALASSNWQKAQDEANKKKRREEQREKLKKERDAAQRFARLEGKGLGDGDDGEKEIDTRSWLIGAQKRQKKIERERARMLQRELEERERTQTQYTEKDLAGQKVGHELDDFDEGEQVLTLKDAAVDDEDVEDELENADLRDKERTKERNRLKLKKPVYDPNADDDEGQRTILGQYDEEIEGKKTKRFTLDGSGGTKEQAKALAEGNSTHGMKFSLDFIQDDKPVSDYIDISEVKIKKPKKKKEKSKRHRDDDDDIFPTDNATSSKHNNEGTMGAAPAQSNGENKRRFEETSFADDDDLQNQLAIQRRAALKKRKLARPEAIARQVREETFATPDPNAMETDVKLDESEEGGLIIDEASEFVANLQNQEAPESRQSASARPSNSAKLEASADSPAVDGEGDVKMSPQDQGGAADSEDEREDSDDNVNAHTIKRENSTPLPPDDHAASGLGDERNLNNGGIGATLGMLTQRGILKTGRGGELNTAHSHQAEFLSHKERLEREWERKAQDKRKRDRDNGLFERMSKRQQEEYAQQENKQREQYVSRQLDELFNKEYRPNVELRYVDDHGRHMDQREAFKQMSHQFHGKGSGKLKTEKRLKKIDDEKKREAASVLDSNQGTGMNNAMDTMNKKNRQAGVRLQ